MEQSTTTRTVLLRHYTVLGHRRRTTEKQWRHDPGKLRNLQRRHKQAMEEALHRLIILSRLNLHMHDWCV